MSRLAKKTIPLPNSVTYSLDGEKAVFKGPKGEARFFINENINIVRESDELRIVSKKTLKNTKSLLGTTFSLLKSAIKGVQEGFEKKLEVEGIGYKAQLEGDIISLFLGFTNPVKIKAPKGIYFKVEKNSITVSGSDKELVGRVAAIIRSQKPPEPYKGKGIHYLGEIIRRKAGKKAVGTT